MPLKLHGIIHPQKYLSSIKKLAVKIAKSYIILTLFVTDEEVK